MKKMTLIIAALCGAALVAPAGQLLTGQVTVPAGYTNAVDEITLNPSGSIEAPAIDRLVVENASAAGTGTVAFAAVAANVAVPIAQTNAVVPGASAAIWPKRQYVIGGTTNVELYTAHKLRVSVYQGSTNAADCVYPYGVICK